MSVIDPDTVGKLGEIIGLLVAGICASILMYLRAPRKSNTVNPMIAGIGMGLLEKHDIERLLNACETIAKDVRIIAQGITQLADRRQADMEDSLEAIKEALKSQKRT